MTSRWIAALLLASLTLPLAAQSNNRGRNGQRIGPGSIDEIDPNVAWKFLQDNAVLHEKAITVYWLPPSLKEAQKSPLMTSKSFLAATTRCVDFEIVLPERTAPIAKLFPSGPPPLALMVDREGKVIRGVSTTKDIEKMVSIELDARDEAMLHTMTEADAQVRAGNNAAAIELYKKIWDDRCLFTFAGAEAQRALKRLGVTVAEPAPKSPQPPPPPVQIESKPPGHAPGQ
ncbi:MAG TPA: hypothetical protein VJ901_12010 [Thermoanaerobaculia bacterium]|nr:hypothetical protein [Thermoanaerobaculia bacterium]